MRIRLSHLFTERKSKSGLDAQKNNAPIPIKALGHRQLKEIIVKEHHIECDTTSQSVKPYFNNDLAASTAFSAVMPNSLYRTSAGADSPKECMPMIAPFKPVYLNQ